MSYTVLVLLMLIKLIYSQHWIGRKLGTEEYNKEIPTILFVYFQREMDFMK